VADVLALPPTPVPSGAATVGGNVQAKPADLAARAGVSLDVYALGRNVSSETGSATPEQQMVVALAAINHARKKGKSVSAMLLSAKPGWAGFFGPIHDPGTGVAGHSMGRWAATSKDPNLRNLKVAEIALTGAAEDFSPVDDQYGPQYNLAGAIANKVRVQAASHSYWIGHLPNVNPHQVMGFVTLPNVAASSAQGQALQAAAIQMLQSPGVYPKPTAIGGRPLGFLFALLGLGGAWWWLRRARRGR
jgi:hypothetical protein